MLRTAISVAAVGTLLLIGTSSTIAESLSPASKSSGEIATASKVLAEKQENCRIQAKQQKLTFLKRRRFVRACMKKTP